MMELHASRLPLAFKCAASLAPQPGEVKVDQVMEAARLGVAAHEAMARVVGHDLLPDLDALAEIHDCNIDELSMLCRHGSQAWADLEGYYPEAFVEQEGFVNLTDDVALVGTIDVLQETQVGARVLDWKTGRLENDYMPQLLAYLLLAEQIIGREIQAGEATVVYLRPMYAKTITVDREMLADFKTRLVKHVVGKMDTYSPGPHCLHCPRFASCPGRKQLATVLTEDIGQEGLLQLIADGRMAAAGKKLLAGIEKVKAVRGLVERADAVIRDILSEYGPIPCPTESEPKRCVYLKDYYVRSVNHAGDAVALLDEKRVMSIGDALSCCEISRTKIEKIVKAKADRGQKGKAAASVAKLLEDHGLIDKSPRSRITCGIPDADNED